MKRVALILLVALAAGGMNIAADLGAVSADIINIVAALEDLYGVVIGEEELPDLRTVDQLHRLVCERVEAR